MNPVSHTIIIMPKYKLFNNTQWLNSANDIQSPTDKPMVDSVKSYQAAKLAVTSRKKISLLHLWTAAVLVVHTDTVATKNIYPYGTTWEQILAATTKHFSNAWHPRNIA